MPSHLGQIPANQAPWRPEAKARAAVESDHDPCTCIPRLAGLLSLACCSPCQNRGMDSQWSYRFGMEHVVDRSVAIHLPRDGNKAEVNLDRQKCLPLDTAI